MSNTKSLSLFQALNSNTKICRKQWRVWLENQTHFYLQLLWHWQGACLSFVRGKASLTGQLVTRPLWKWEVRKNGCFLCLCSKVAPLPRMSVRHWAFLPLLLQVFLAVLKLVSLFYQHSRWSMLGIQSNKFMNHLKKHTRAQAESVLFVRVIFKDIDRAQIPTCCNPALLTGFNSSRLLLVRSSPLQLGCQGNTGRRPDLPVTLCVLNDNHLFSPPAEGKDSAGLPGCHHKQDAQKTSKNVLWTTVGQDLKQRRAESTETHLWNTGFHLCTQLFWGCAKGMLCLHTL